MYLATLVQFGCVLAAPEEEKMISLTFDGGGKRECSTTSNIYDPGVGRVQRFLEVNLRLERLVSYFYIFRGNSRKMGIGVCASGQYSDAFAARELCVRLKL